ncbi:MAG: M15 family metallopeptidase [Candidatus Ornithomonoglobus sp.]
MDYRKEVIQRRRDRIYRRKIKRIKIAIVFAVAIILLLIAAIVFINIRNTSEAPPPAGTEVPSSVTATPAVQPEETSLPTSEPTPEPIQRRGTATDIPDDVRRMMAGYSMPEGATITYDDLSYLTIPHYDFEYNIVEGHLVVNKALAEEVLDIFAELFDIKYPIERMELVDKYNADDYLSIDNNNTSAFNYRESTDGTGRLSKHALGRAIDINPQINPYVGSDGTGAHENAREYWSRDISTWSGETAKAAYIGPDTEIYKIFVEKYGWEWGGSWSSYRDYQHFQKTS